jgi:hypothetical protein
MVDLKILAGSIAIAIAVSVSVTYSVTHNADQSACSVSTAQAVQNAALRAMQQTTERDRAELAHALKTVTSGVDKTPNL